MCQRLGLSRDLKCNRSFGLNKPCHIPAQMVVGVHYSDIPMPQDRSIPGKSANLWHIVTCGFIGLVNPLFIGVYVLLCITLIIGRLKRRGVNLFLIPFGCNRADQEISRSPPPLDRNSFGAKILIESTQQQ